jgi:hypothetical protein
MLAAGLNGFGRCRRVVRISGQTARALVLVRTARGAAGRQRQEHRDGGSENHRYAYRSRSELRESCHALIIPDRGGGSIEESAT